MGSEMCIRDSFSFCAFLTSVSVALVELVAAAASAPALVLARVLRITLMRLDVRHF